MHRQVHAHPFAKKCILKCLKVISAKALGMATALKQAGKGRVGL